VRTHKVHPDTMTYMLEWCWNGVTDARSKRDLLAAPSIPGFHGHVLGVWTHCPKCNGEYVEVNTLAGRMIDRCACYWERQA